MKQIIGKTVKAIRIKQGISPEDWAHECDVDRSFISMIEVGRNEPSVTKIFDLCRGLRIKPSEFSSLWRWNMSECKMANILKNMNWEPSLILFSSI
ncbi:XRE family transcriptional regulator [Xylanibacillus composti]|uniref:helix-turn-helix domain-containing protein n=1 Tax=Xylanibacillus composti TaxID=1572762 RepID=UPI001BCEBE79|nr:XRE family transcriptional regulator [Xylanibacillus composti]